MRSAKRGVWPAVLSLWGLLVSVCARVKEGIWRAVTPLLLLLASVVFQAGCACEPEGQVKRSTTLPCRSQHDKLPVFPRRTSPLVLMPGTTPVTYGVTSTGESAMSMPLVVPPGRAGVEPSLAVYYSSNGVDGVLGRGFSISGASSIQRCPKTRAIDGPDAETGTV